MTDRRADPAPASGALWRNLLRLCIVAALALGLHLAVGWARARVGEDSAASALMPALLVGLLMLYALLIALPFVPGVEIGLALMAMQGPWIAPWIYLATLAGLGLAFAAGACLPYTPLRRVLADLRLTRVCQLIDRLEKLDRSARLALVAASAPRWLGPLTRFRHLVLALLVNLPGNSVLGGGGGLLLLAGFSRLFSPLATLATLALAVAPVPLLVWGLDLDATAWAP
ncbi:MAG: hypothetical protein AUK37_04055 [Rhodobacterales bacterium CG2_30_65_12]|nr:MAG: hypothetical protein AUK37_04055 [Rhodobacterales bacterium CG2_30_65_12]